MFYAVISLKHSCKPAHAKRTQKCTCASKLTHTQANTDTQTRMRAHLLKLITSSNHSTWYCIVQNKANQSTDKHTGTKQHLDDLVHCLIT